MLPKKWSPPPRRLCDPPCLSVWRFVCWIVCRNIQKLLCQFSRNLVGGWGMGRGRTHQIWGQIWIIYYDSEFFRICFLTLALAEARALLSAISSNKYCQQSYLKDDHFTLEKCHKVSRFFAHGYSHLDRFTTVLLIQVRSLKCWGCQFILCCMTPLMLLVVKIITISDNRKNPRQGMWRIDFVVSNFVRNLIEYDPELSLLC